MASNYIPSGTYINNLIYPATGRTSSHALTEYEANWFSLRQHIDAISSIIGRSMSDRFLFRLLLDRFRMEVPLENWSSINDNTEIAQIPEARQYVERILVCANNVLNIEHDGIYGFSCAWLYDMLVDLHIGRMENILQRCVPAARLPGWKLPTSYADVDESACVRVLTHYHQTHDHVFVKHLGPVSIFHKLVHHPAKRVSSFAKQILWQADKRLLR